MSEILLPLKVDHKSSLVLAASNLPSGLAAGVFALLSLGAFWLTPLRIAPWLFASLSLWQAALALKTHELKLDGETRRLTYRQGLRLGPPTFSESYSKGHGGSLPEDQARLGLSIEGHQGDPGLVSSPLRSHKLILSVELPSPKPAAAAAPAAAAPLRFRIGYPMGSKAAEERAQDLCRRFGLDLADTTPSMTTDAETTTGPDKFDLGSVRDHRP